MTVYPSFMAFNPFSTNFKSQSVKCFDLITGWEFLVKCIYNVDFTLKSEINVDFGVEVVYRYFLAAYMISFFSLAKQTRLKGI